MEKLVSIGERIRALPRAERSQYEAIADKFEDKWRATPDLPPDIATWLPPNQPLRTLVLVALVKEDMENRARRQPAKVEEYFNRFEELHDDRAAKLDLIEWESEISARDGKLRDYMRLFPDLAEWLDPVRPWTGPPNYSGLEHLKQGGMGDVWRATQQTGSGSRLVALKTIRTGFFHSERAKLRFLREIAAVAKLGTDANIVEVYDVGEHDGRRYFSMPFLSGESLKMLHDVSKKGQKRIAAVMATIAMAVHRVHAQGIIHRDLKPANILLTDTGRPMLTDFGVAAFLGGEDKDVDSLTLAGEIVGTPSYMAPEQAGGAGAHPLADVYALGAILYELLTNQPPFREETAAATVQQVLTQDPKWPRQRKPEVLRDIETICMKCLDRTPGNRYASAGELALDLNLFREGQPINARRTGTLGRAWKWVQRNPAVTGVALVALVLLLGLGYAWIVNRNSFQQDLVQKEDEKKELVSLKNLVGSFDLVVGKKVWSPEDLALVKRRLEEIRSRDAEAAKANVTKFAREIRKQIDQLARLEKKDEMRLGEAVKILKGFDSGRGEAKELKWALTRRLPNWWQQWTLTDQNSQTIFSPQTVKVDAGVARVKAKVGKFKIPAERVVTLSKCAAGGAKLVAEFEQSWNTASEIGLELNATGKRGYVFSLHLIALKSRDGTPTVVPASFQEARKAGGEVECRISRDSVVIHTKTYSANDLPEGRLKLTARREGQHLWLDVQDREFLDFEDVFALPSKDSGLFAVHWPERVPLRSLEAYEFTGPPNPSSLEEGDALYLAGEHAEARGYFDKLMQPNGTRPVDQEVRYKHGMCLLTIDPKTAAEDFKAIANQVGDRWPFAAFVQLWKLHLESNEMELADTLFDRWYNRPSSAFDFSKLVRLVPEETRRILLNVYKSRAKSIHEYKSAHDKRIQLARRWVDVETVVKGNLTESALWLNKAFFLKGQMKLALTHFDDTIMKKNAASLFLFGERMWLFRLVNGPDKALKELEKHTRADHSKSAMLFLALLKAECHFATKDWRRVEEELAPYLLRNCFGPEPDRELRRDLTRAWLMQGFVLESRGDQPGAEQAWGKAANLVNTPSKEGGLLDFLISRSLAGKSNGDDVEEFLIRGERAKKGAWLAFLKRMLPLDTPLEPVAKEMWRTPTGREWARTFVFRQHTMLEQFWTPPKLAASEFVRQYALCSTEDSRQRELCRQAADEVFRLAIENPDGLLTHAAAAINAWMGNCSVTELEKLLAGLVPNFCAQAAYMAAHRMLKLKKTKKEIDEYFDLAERLGKMHAPKDSSLSGLAKTDRDLLGAKKGLLILHSDAPGKVTLTVRSGDKVIKVELENQRVVDLEVGSYQLQLGKDASDVNISTDRVSITLCGRVNVHIHDRWKPASAEAPLPGLVPRPALGLGLGRWQLETRESRGGWTSVALSPDGNLLAFAAQDGQVRVKDVKSGELRHFFVGHTAEVACVAWSPDNRFLASGGWDQNIRIWDIKRDKLHLVLRPPLLQPGITSQQQVIALAWNSDGRLLMSGGPEHLRLWDAGDGKLMSNILPGAGVVAVAWSPTNESEFAVARAKEVQVWKVTWKGVGRHSVVKQLIRPLSGEIQEIYCVTWSPDGKRIAVGGKGKLVSLWNARDGKQERTMSPVGRTIRALAWDRMTNRLAVGTQEGFASLHDGVTGKLVWVSPQCSRIYSLFWPRNSFRFLTGHWDHSYRFWNAADGKVAATFSSPNCAFSAITFRPDGKMLAIGAQDGTIRFGNLDSCESELIGGFPLGIERIAWSKATNRLAVIGWGGTIHLREAGSRTSPKSFTTHSKTIYGIDWSPDGKLLVSGGEDKSVRIWNTDGRPVANPVEPGARVRAVAWSPDGNRIAIGLGEDEKPARIRIWNVQRHTFDVDLRGHTKGILRLRWDSKSQRLASSSDDGAVRLWDLGGRPEGPVLQQGEHVHALAWSPDNSLLATGDYRGACRIWTADSKKVVQTIKASYGPIRALAWTADGKQLISGGDDGVVRYWDAKSGDPIRLLVHLPNEQAVELTSGGKILHSTPKADDELLYLHEDDTGKIERLCPAQFKKLLKSRPVGSQASESRPSGKQ